MRQIRQNSSVQLLTAATTTQSSEKHTPWGPKLSVQAIGRTTSSSGSVTVAIEVSNVPNPTANSQWLRALEIELTLGTTDVGDGQQIDANWRHIRARVTAISGTGANVDVYLGG